MQDHNITAEEVMELAENAKEHARTYILKGSSQPENNELEESYFSSLNQGVADVRDVIKEKVSSNRIESRTLAWHEARVAVTSKYSLGNCHELAYLALDYVLKNSDIHAELFHIKGGDHTFLVLNRAPGSNPSKPDTWGPNAVICDPWANKVYKASKYATKLKNFYRTKDEDGNEKNLTEDFNSSKHKLSLVGNYNTTYLRQAKNVDLLKKNFLSELTHLEQVMNKYKDRLDKVKKRLQKKYGEDHPKVLIMTKKIDAINDSIDQIRANFDTISEKKYKKTDYDTVKSELNSKLQNLTKDAFLSMKFSKDDLKELFKIEPKKPKKILKINMPTSRFFERKIITPKKLERFTDEVNTSYNKRSK